MTDVPALTVSAIRPRIEGKPITDFDDVIEPDRLSIPDLEIYDHTSPSGETPEWSARVYVWPGSPKPPPWAAFLTAQFSSLAVPNTAQSRAVVIVKVFWRKDRYFAVTFGGGRFQLRRGAAERSYGLRVALNAIYEGDKDAATLDPVSRIRQVDTRTVGANTIRTRRQTNRSAEFDVFELDPEGDQLNGITGSPLAGQTDLLGKRVTGSNSLRIARWTVFTELGRICRELARYHEQKDYERRFKFVDNYRRVAGASRIDELNEVVTEAVSDEDSDLQFSVPALLDYDDIDTFRIRDLDLDSPDLDIVDIRKALADEGDITFESLESKTVQVISDSGLTVERWPLSSCLDGQLTDAAGTTYVVEGGEYFEIAPDYLAALDGYMDGIALSAITLPDSVRVLDDEELKEIAEGDYNEIAADSSADYLLMDKKTVTVSVKTSPIEVCDVLTLQGQFVHVKRKFSSSSLSHLFGQGYVSSELLFDSPEYREKCRVEIGTGNSAFQALIPDDAIVPANYEIIYAIVGKWNDRKLRDLPFFSKINLRKHTRSLRRMGFAVTYAAVHVVDPPA